MKKKLIPFFIFIYFAASSFATAFNIEISGSFPGEMSDYKYAVSGGGSIGADIMFTEKLGFGLDFGVYAPIIGFGNATGGIFLQNADVDNTYVYGCRYEGQVVNLDIFSGVVIKVMKQEKFELFLTPGINADVQFLTVKDINDKDLHNDNVVLGIGVDLKADYNINSFFTLHGALYQGFPLVQLSSMKAKTVFDPGIKNTLRLGVTFKIK